LCGDAESRVKPTMPSRVEGDEESFGRSHRECFHEQAIANPLVSKNFVGVVGKHFAV
jgi:hypothetical protein